MNRSNHLTRRWGRAVRNAARVGPTFCLFGFGYENGFCTFNKRGLSDELGRQIQGAGREGAFVAGTPIMPPNAMPEAVDFYFAEACRLGSYGGRSETAQELA